MGTSMVCNSAAKETQCASPSSLEHNNADWSSYSTLVIVVYVKT